MRTFYSLRRAHFHISALSLLLHITNVLCKFSNPWLHALAGLGVVQHSALPASCWVADELRVQDAKESKVGKATKQGSERWRPDCWAASWRNCSVLGLKNGQAIRSRGEALGLEVGVGNEARPVQGDLGLLGKRYLPTSSYKFPVSPGASSILSWSWGGFIWL